MKTSKKYILLGLLYTTQTLPIAFMSIALPTIMRLEGMTLKSITYMSLVAIPLTVRFLWAPLIDRYGKTYFCWVTIFTVLYALFFFPSYFIELHQVSQLVVLFTLAMICMSFQDIAMDAFLITSLKAEQRSIGNGIQTGGNYLGLLLGGGVLLLFYDKLGWKNTILIMSLLTILPITITLFFSDESKKLKTYQKVRITDIFSYFREKEFRKWMPILMLLIIPVNIALSFTKPLLIDKGFSVSQVGYMIGLFGGIATVCSGFVSGIILKAASVRFKLLTAVTSSIIAVGSAFMLEATNINQIITVLLYCVVIGIMVGVNMMVINEISMKYVRKGKEGLDYSIQQFLRYILYTPLIVVCGGVIDAYGYNIIFYIMFGIALLLILMVIHNYKY